jgi:hypothetical protein
MANNVETVIRTIFHNSIMPTKPLLKNKIKEK